MSHSRRPVYLLAGRGSSARSNQQALAEAFALVGGKPDVAYIGVASGDDRGFFGMIGAMLKDAGAAQVRLAALVSDKADVAKARAIVEGADVVFVSGGDVEEGMNVLRRRRMLPLLRRLQQEGRVFCGVSAGSIMLAPQWVRWRDPQDEGTAERFDCLGLAPLRCDAHGEQEHWEELRALLRLCPPGTEGYGIRSGACLVACPDGAARACVGVVDRFRRGAEGVEERPALGA